MRNVNPDTVVETVREHGGGMFFDFVFAVVWVTAMTAVHGAFGGPEWAYYVLLLAGVPAYFVFYASLSTARETTEGEKEKND